MSIEPAATVSGIDAIIGGSGIGGGALLTYLYLYFKNSDKYVSKADCKHTMEQCPMINSLRTEFITHKTTVTIELRQLHKDIAEIKKDTGTIAEHMYKLSEAVAVIAAQGNR